MNVKPIEIANWNINQENHISQERTNQDQKTLALSTKVLKSITYGDGMYTGEVEDGKANGQGTFVHTIDMCKISGTFVDDKIKHGSFKDIKGNSYSGGFKNWQFHGHGVFIAHYGDTYEGEFNLSKFHGKGIMTYSNGYVYEGNWVNGHYSLGKLTYSNDSDRDYYEGQFTDEDPDGEGILVYKNGKGYFKGVFDTGTERNGVGEQIYNDDSSYKGEYKRGLYNGFGEYKSKSGKTFVGEFKEGLMTGRTHKGNKNEELKRVTQVNGNGPEEIHFSEGDHRENFKGNFLNGLAHGQGKLIFIDGSFYEGNFVEGYMQGQGRFKFSESSRSKEYKGEFHKNEFDGAGALLISNGSTISGQFVKGLVEGHAKVVSKEGSSFVGNFKNGEIDGKVCLSDEELGKVELDRIGTKIYCKALTEIDGVYHVARFSTEKNQEVLQNSLVKVKNPAKALAAFEKNFEIFRKSISREVENRLSLEEKKARNKRKDNEIDALVKELGLSETTNNNAKGKGKGKSLKQPVKKETKSSSSSSSQEVPHKDVEINDPIKRSPAGQFYSLPRVKRWHTKDYEKIRKFEDFKEGTALSQYSHLTNQQIDVQRSRHYLPQVELLLGPQNENVYYVKTDRGFSMVASLIRNENDIEYGYLSFGVEKVTKTIFHKMFSPVENNNFSQFFKTPEVFENCDNDNSWEPADTTSWTVLDKGVIDFVFTGESHKLRIFPLLQGELYL